MKFTLETRGSHVGLATRTFRRWGRLYGIAVKMFCQCPWRPTEERLFRDSHAPTASNWQDRAGGGQSSPMGKSNRSYLPKGVFNVEQASLLADSVLFGCDKSLCRTP